MIRLKEMFPNEDDSTFQHALSSFGGDINKAAAKLAGCIDEGITEQLTEILSCLSTNTGMELVIL